MIQSNHDAIPVLFADEHYIAVDKPANLLVHKSRLSRDKVYLLQLLRDQIGKHVYPVHRLDRATSGVMVFGLSSEAANRLNTLFSERQVSKTYHAVVRGWLAQSKVLVDRPIQDRETDTPYQDAQTQLCEIARTELPFAVDRYPQARYSLIRAQPLTGRRHQIRKHLKHISHPIIGDIRYGKGTHNRFFRQHFGIYRLLLIASGLCFHHPFTGEEININVQPDQEWLSLLDTLGWSLAKDIA